MRTSLCSVLFLLVLTLGPAPPAEARGYRCGSCGTVDSVERFTERQGERHRGGDDRRDGTAGMILGALIGGALGNQVGGGRGRDAATIAGAVVGGAVGRNVQRDNARRDDHRTARFEREVEYDDASRYDDEDERRHGDRGYGDRYGDRDRDITVTRLRVRMDSGRTRTIDVAGNLRVYRGDRIRVRNDRIVMLN